MAASGFLKIGDERPIEGFPARLQRDFFLFGKLQQFRHGHAIPPPISEQPAVQELNRQNVVIGEHGPPAHRCACNIAQVKAHS